MTMGESDFIDIIDNDDSGINTITADYPAT